jgi:hypothetical protein
MDEQDCCDCGNEKFLDLDFCEECSEGLRCAICDQTYVKCYYNQCQPKKKKRVEIYHIVRPLLVPENLVKKKVVKQNSIRDMDCTMEED